MIHFLSNKGLDLTDLQQPLLSICIATFKRGPFIEQTLRNILAQVTDQVEVVVLDGNSPDQTEEVVARLTKEFSRLRYIKESTNSGVDQDFDKAAQQARGQYCWLMTDDDLIESGAVDKILNELKSEPSVLIVNSAVYDRTFETLLLEKFIKTETDHTFEGHELEPFLALTGACLSFIGGVIIKRNEWLSRDRKSYYGSLFIHVGTIFQKVFPGKLRVLAKPLIKIRYGNAMWTSRGFEIWMVKWPDLIHSFTHFSLESRNAVCPKSFGRTMKYLAYYRGMGIYSLKEFNTLMRSRLSSGPRLMAFLIAVFPQQLMSSLLGLYFGFVNKNNRLGFYDLILSHGLNSLTAWIAEKKVFGSKIWLKKA